MANFKTRARAIDMLGKQQIAGIPTAISELFKNSYDAYATIAKVDFFKTLNLFVLSDNGIGMTRNDFENKWLAIGTDSKFKKKSEFIPNEMAERPVLGEKGIGRLAISTIGQQVLILTRAKREEQIQNLIISYIHWGIFEIPGINLEDINIPIIELSGNIIPSEDDIDSLINDFSKNIDKFAVEIDEQRKEIFNKDFKAAKEKFKVQLLTQKIGNPSIINGVGTQFFIAPVNELLEEQISDWNTADKTSSLRQTLIGFYNTMTNPIEKQEMKTVFNVYERLESCNNLLEDSRFWSEEDFNKSDVYFSGNFNEYGVFNGKIRIYGYEQEYTIKCTNKSDSLFCGPFKITLGFIPGRSSESLLSEKDYNDYDERLKSLGAIYIYRNNIRMLPYGTPEFDFLKLEIERTKKAGDFLFSHRRMFAAIELTNENNYMLKEKAGREGFIENRAYIEFKEILINLLKNIMTDFLKKDAKINSTYENKKKELLEIDKQNKALKEQEKRNKVIINDFKKSLLALLKEFESPSFVSDIDLKIEDFKVSVDKYKYTKNIDKLLSIKTEIINYFNNFQTKYKITKPRGVILPENVDDILDNYIKKYEDIKEYIAKEVESLTCLINTTVEELSNCNTIENYKNILNEQLELVQRAKSYKKNKFNSIIDIVNKNLEIILKQITLPQDSKLQELEDYLNFQLSLNEHDNKILTINYTKDIDTIKSEYDNIFEKIEYALLNSISVSNNELISNEDLLEAYQKEIINFKKNNETDMELLQKGLAIDVINHEFTNNIKYVRDNIKHLRAWAEQNAKLMELYNNIYNGFMHLDGYLALFTKLQRRLYRTPIEISGSSILRYVQDIFKEKLESHNINLTASEPFKSKIIKGFPSTFYPVFINLVDNSIYWIKEYTKDKNIYFETDKNNNWIIRDNGPGIKKQDEQRIFEKGFSRKESGRGLGLYICKEVLKEEGYDIYPDITNTDGAKFVIVQDGDI